MTNFGKYQKVQLITSLVSSGNSGTMIIGRPFDQWVAAQKCTRLPVNGLVSDACSLGWAWGGFCCQLHSLPFHRMP